MNGFEVEMRDDAVRGHALRLGVLPSLVAASGNGQVRHSVVRDGRLVRLIMSFSGRADGNNGLMMVTAPDSPGVRAILHALAAANYESLPTTERIPSPCMN